MSDHALFSPSGAHRWIACPGSLALESTYPRTSSAFADEGTAAHELASWCLSERLDADAYVGRIIAVGAREFTVDLDMAANVQTYVDAVRQYADGGILMVEQRVAFGGMIDQPDDKAFGTSDAVIITPDNELQVHDLKYGRGVEVSATENEQMMLYALGALDAYDMLGPFQRIRLVIHQPRLGALSEWDLSYHYLMASAERVKNAAAIALAIKINFDAGAEGADPAGLFNGGWLIPDDHACRFCKAKADCPALAAQVVTALVGKPDLAGFTDITSATIAHGTEQLPILYGDALGARMALVDQVEAWCKAVRARVEAELFAGRNVAGFKLVEGKRGNRAWADAAEAEAAFKAMRIKQEVMYDFKLISPTAAEKLAKDGTIGPRQWPKLEGLIVRADGKPSVAPASDKRPPLALPDAMVGMQVETADDYA